MLHELGDHILETLYLPGRVRQGDLAVVMDARGRVLVEDEPAPRLPACETLGLDAAQGRFLFSLDGVGFHLFLGDLEENEVRHYRDVRVFRDMQPKWLGFAGATACHLASWYQRRIFCGRCATRLDHKPNQRALVCPSCGTEEYPAIAPAVIVGVIDGERLLLTKYADRPYRNYALIAGYVEIGETLEETVRREAMEEVGLALTNIRYYASQPWPFSGSVLMGFFADLASADTVTLDTVELAEARWFNREDIPVEEPPLSLTRHMIEAFRLGKL